MTTDEAREALLTMLRRMDCQDLFDDAFTLLVNHEAAIRAESPEWRVEAWRKQALAAEAKLEEARAALVVKAAVAAIHAERTWKRVGGPKALHNRSTKWAVLDAAVAAYENDPDRRNQADTETMA